MNEFNHIDIFATKGIEYILVIAFLLMVIPFWKYVFAPTVADDLATVTTWPVWNRFRSSMPAGFYLDKTHSWSFLQPDGNVLTGPDNFLLANTGPVSYGELLHVGDHIKKGDHIGTLMQGTKNLKIVSPVSGRVVQVNQSLSPLKSIPGKAEDYPWTYKIKPDNWKLEMNSLLAATDGDDWIHNEYDQLKDFLSFSMNKYGLSGREVILAAGGEIADRVLSSLPEEIWEEFQVEFITSRTERGEIE